MSRIANRMKRNQRKNTFKNRGKRGGRTPTHLGNVDLPHINQKPIQTRCIRYAANGTLVSGTPEVFAVADLRAILGAVTNASTVYTPLIDSFRVRRIGYSAILSGTAGSANITFAWEGPNVPDISDTSFVGVSIPITRSYYPPPNSSSEWWYDNGATSVNLFSILYSDENATQVTLYLDIDFEYILQDGVQTTLTLSANATYTGLAVIALPLGSSTFTPVGLSTVHT